MFVRDQSCGISSPLHTLKMLISLTVGKVDAGVAVLLTEDKRLVRTQPLLTTLHSHLTEPLHF